MVSIGLSSATVAVQFSGPSCEELTGRECMQYF